MSNTFRKGKNKHVTKKQDAKSEEGKKPKQTDTSEEKPLMSYRKEGNFKKAGWGWRGGKQH